MPRAAAGAALPVLTGALVWSWAGLAEVDQAQRALPVLLVVGLLAVARPRVPTEVAAAVTGTVGTLVALDATVGPASTSLAVHLTVAGALVSLGALAHRDRRVLAWPGGLLLAAATWVRLADLGVSAPEAYTLPTALVLVAVGVLRLARDPGASTRTALVPGLVLAVTPSLLWVLATDPVSLRALLLGTACLALTLGGALARWAAPVVVGTVAGGVLALAELAPYAAATPQWVLLGLAGAALTLGGVTWEHRMADLRRGGALLARLR